MNKVLITGEDLTLDEIVSVCRGNAQVEISQEAREKVQASRQVVDDLIAEEKVVYGITTGFGKFSDVVISQDQCKELQKNLIITHAVGAGDPFSRDIARGIMLLRINNLSKGFSGIRMETLQTMAYMLNKGVTPIIPEKGFSGRFRRSGSSFPHGSADDRTGTGRVSGRGASWKRGHGPGRNSSDRAFSQGRLGAEQRNAGHDKRRLFSAL